MSTLVTLLFHDLYDEDPAESGFNSPAADRYKLPVAAFDRQIRSVLHVHRECPVVLTGKQHQVIADGSFAITVDDGGLSYYALLADRLEEHDWRGHCLVTTGCIGRNGFMQAHHIRELHARGHVIGSHTASHPDKFHTCSWRTLVSEWKKSKDILEDLIGYPVSIGSVPGGNYSKRVAQAASEAGLKILFTSEPERRQRDVHGCQVIGRYALRRDSDPALSGSLVSQKSLTLLREWLAWNTKKVVKTALGSGYMQLADLLDRSN